MVSALFNILLQAIEALICFYFYESITQLGKNRMRLVYLFASYAVMTAFNLFFNYNVFVNTAVFVLFHFLILRYVYKFNLRFSFVYAAVMALSVAITDISSELIISYIFNSEPKGYTKDYLSYTLLITISKTLLFVLLKAVSDIIGRYRQNKKTHFIFFLYPLSLLIVLILYVPIYENYNLSGKMKIIISAAIIFMISSVILTCIFQQATANREAELYELRAAVQKEEIEKTYFELLERQNEELQMFVHDTKNHLTNLYALTQEPERAREYITSFADNIDSANQIGKSSNKLLDLIIRKYCLLCEKRGISFERNIHRSNLDFIDDTDLTSLLNNLLDNAVEAAEKSGEKFISLSINNFGSMVHISICNSCVKAPKTENGVLLSQKKDKGSHGYGHKSVIRTVKKYDGDFHWEYDPEERKFTVSVILPVSE